MSRRIPDRGSFFAFYLHLLRENDLRNLHRPVIGIAETAATVIANLVGIQIAIMAFAAIIADLFRIKGTSGQVSSLLMSMDG
jgi:hypothetical protein